MKNTARSTPSERQDPPGLTDQEILSAPTAEPVSGRSVFSTLQLVYDGTLHFCVRFIEPGNPAHSRMAQAARNALHTLGHATPTTDRPESRLASLARASLEELRADYEEQLRRNGQRLWARNSPAALALGCRCLAGMPASATPDELSDPFGLRTAPLATAANTLLGLIAHASRQLDHRVRELEAGRGGTSNSVEQSLPVRRRMLSDRSAAPAEPGPPCPICGRPMRRRTARNGPNAGEAFWGCSRYPGCNGTRPLAADP